MKNIGLSYEKGSFSKLTGIYKGDIQPNGVDLRLGKVFNIQPTLFTIDDDQKIHRDIQEEPTDSDEYYYLKPGLYLGVMQNEIEVASEEAGFVITRSTLMRNGVIVSSGLYDSGYSGSMSALIQVCVGDMRIKKGTRIGQYISFEAMMANKYAGDYGRNKEHDKKYE